MTERLGSLLAAVVLLGACAHEPSQPPSAKTSELTLVVPTSLTQCERLRAEGKLRVQLRAVEAVKALQPLADATCFSFAVEKGLSATLTIHPGEDEPVPEWNWSEFFNAVRTELERQGVLLREEGARRYRVGAVR